MTRKQIPVLTLKTDVCDRESAVETIAAMEGGGYVCVATVHMVMEAYDDPEFAAKVNAASLVVPDGMPLLWMQRLQGAPGARRVRGNDLMTDLLRWAEDGLRVGFYGGSQEVLDRLEKQAIGDFPELTITYRYSPPFRALTAEEDAKIVEDINSAGLDILFVGLGCPKQENWMAAHRDRINTVMIGVGAAFDFYAGNLREAPRWLSNIGLEWLFRLAMEPRRLWRRYLILNPRFILLAVEQLLGKKI